MSASSGSKKKRVRKWTPEERAAHRIFEKSRREAFNESMIHLARQIPSLAGTRRLNKHMIVEHSIARHRAQRQLAMSALQDIQTLITERDELLAEVNQWRTANHGLPLRDPGPGGKHMQDLITATNEACGAFPNGFGDNAPEDGSGDDQAVADDAPSTSVATRHVPVTPPDQLPLNNDYNPTSFEEMLNPDDQSTLAPLQPSQDLLEQSTSLDNHVQMIPHVDNAFDPINYANYFINFAPQECDPDSTYIATIAPSMPSQSWLGSHRYHPGIASVHHQDAQPILDPS